MHDDALLPTDGNAAPFLDLWHDHDGRGLLAHEVPFRPALKLSNGPAKIGSSTN